MNGSVSCIECGSAVPADAPDGICPVCLWQLGLNEDSSHWKADEPDSTNAASTHRTTSEATPLLAARSRRTAVLERPAADSPPIIRQLGNYDLIEELGRGGMGVVYKAVQRRADRLVAVKLILGGAASGDESRERFQSEVQLLAKLRHPNIVPVFEVGDEEGSPYFSMEYMPGGSLSDKAKQAPLAPADAARIVEQLASAVHAAHQVGVLHRDIKPGNVLLDEGGAPKLTDFGLAKRLDRDDGLTHTGSVLGTPGYMPPEQARGERDLTPAADVYSLGATLYALLIGKSPFAGRNFHETLQHVLNDDPPRPRSKRPDLPRDLEAVCLKCLEKDPTRRYATAQALADDLARWQQGESTIARPQTLPQRALRQARRHWSRAAIASSLIGGTLLIVALATIVVARYSDPLYAIDSALRRGEKVTLLGQVGSPKWHKWELGTGNTSDTKRAFEVFCFGTGYVELVPTTRHRHYRISAEFQADESTERDSWAGVYIGRANALTKDGPGLRAIEVRLFDDRATLKPLFPGKGDSLSVQDFLRTSAPDEPAKFQAIGLASAWIKQSPEQKQAISAWRRLTVSVHSNGIRVQLFPSREAAPISAVPNLIPLETLPKRQVAFNPQGGCGLFVRNARVYFRNVVLEPLP